jgi:kumamolisin
LRDITSGSNGAYQAGPGWDPVTGLGVPDVKALIETLP